MEMILNDEFFMRAALAEAKAGMNEGEVPVGAVVVCNNRIIARAHNLTETLNDTTAHAEMQAITSATAFLGGKYLHDCTIYVTLEPCVMCAGALFWSQAGRLVYGASDEKRGYTLLKREVLHPRTGVTGQILHEECGTIIKDFFKHKR
jgi:tRNA(adenine34) deaminase